MLSMHVSLALWHEHIYQKNKYLPMHTYNSTYTVLHYIFFKTNQITYYTLFAKNNNKKTHTYTHILRNTGMIHQPHKTGAQSYKEV